MKIVGLILAGVFITLPTVSFAGLKCQGDLYTGSYSRSTLRVNTLVTQAVLSKKDGEDFEIKLDGNGQFNPEDFDYYTSQESDHKIRIQSVQSYRRPSEESPFKFNDKTVIGLNIVCKM